jgi:medium-chain acyl-[acyl-carrier-protein] hydrolase
MREQQVTEMTDLLDRLVAAMFTNLTNPPFVLFGHSMGAVIAYRLVGRLQRVGGPMPLGLIVSAARPPGSPEPDYMTAGMSDNELLNALIQLDGTSAELLKYPDMIDFVIGRLRLDLTLLESAYCLPADVLDCPLDAFGGRHDEIAGPSFMNHWAALTSREFRIHTFEGGHFYLQSYQTALLGQIRAAATRYLAGGESR